MIEQSISLIRKFETYRKFPSRNKFGFLRIGYDHPLCLSERKAFLLLKEDVQFISEFLKQEGLPVNPGLISLIHQIGIITFKKSKLRKALESGDFEAVKKAFMSWSKINGVTDPELYQRRINELAYLENGIA